MINVSAAGVGGPLNMFKQVRLGGDISAASRSAIHEAALAAYDNLRDGFMSKLGAQGIFV